MDSCSYLLPECELLGWVFAVQLWVVSLTSLNFPFLIHKMGLKFPLAPGVCGST